MATNHVQDGKVLKLIAPTGGVVSGGIYAIGALVVIALVTAKKDEEFAASTHALVRNIYERSVGSNVLKFVATV